MDKEYIASNEFLKSYKWRELRQKVLDKYDGRCMCCGATASDDIYLCVDHIKPRKTHPELALDINNLQILCNACNHGKANWNSRDWRSTASFIVNKHWLDTNKTPKGGYTKVQIEALGFKFSNCKGWLKKVLGKHITAEMKKRFEDGAFEGRKDREEIAANRKELNKLTQELEILKLKEEIENLKRKQKST